MKLLITSPDAIIDRSSGNFFQDIVEILDELIKNDSIRIIVFSSHSEKLVNIPDRFKPMEISFSKKGGGHIIETIREKTAYKEYSDMIVLGATDNDFFMSSNKKLLLLAPLWAENNNPDSKVYKYGLRLSSPKALRLLFNKFISISNPWYYKLQVADNTVIYSLINANTMYCDNSDVRRLNYNFKDCLKNHNTTYRFIFNIYFQIAANNILKELRDINYWGIYPSSTTAINEDLDYFKERLRKMYSCKTDEQILIRSREVSRRHSSDKTQRIADGCDSQFGSIIVNDYYKKKIRGKNICIIDDFTTYGSSCETTRHLLTQAGIVFLTLGKFGINYYKYNYVLSGNIYTAGGYTFERIGEPAYMSDGEYNYDFAIDYVNSLGGLIK